MYVYCVQDFLPEEEDEEERESEIENLEMESEEPEANLAMESMESIEHTDSYHLQLQRNKEETIEIVDAEDSLTNVSFEQFETDTTDVEKTFNEQLLEEQNELQTTAGDVIEARDNVSNEDAANVKKSASPELITEDPEEDAGSVAEMLVAERSTASDIVSQAMARAVERTATPQ